MTLVVDANTQFTWSLIVIAIGYGIKRAGLVDKQTGNTLAKLILNITLPALILKTIPAVNIDGGLVLLPLIALGCGICVVGCSRGVFRSQPPNLKGILIASAAGWNIGLFAYPLIEGIWGSTGLQYMAMFDIGNAFIVFGLNYFIVTKFSPLGVEVNMRVMAKRLVTFVPLMCYVVALFLNFSGIIFPVEVMGLLTFIGNANGPLVLLVLGIFLDFSFPQEYWKQVGKSLLVRYGIGILAGCIFFFTLPLAILPRATIAVGLILPVGLVTIPYSVQFQYDERVANAITNISILMSFAGMWLLAVAIPIS